ncbi:MAG: type II toxin-antitoxin system RelE/ParE family toxin [bacterium]|nr:type II toxin-antitoxin system RelE/ParE family toxin [bacterium]
MYRVQIVAQALVEVNHNLSYIRNNLSNQQAANNLKKAFKFSLFSLEVFPHHQVVGIFQGKKLYKISIKNYYAFYFIDEKTKIVSIIYFVHRSRDWSQLFPSTNKLALI